MSRLAANLVEIPCMIMFILIGSLFEAMAVYELPADEEGQIIHEHVDVGWRHRLMTMIMEPLLLSRATSLDQQLLSLSPVELSWREGKELKQRFVSMQCRHSSWPLH